MRTRIEKHSPPDSRKAFLEIKKQLGEYFRGERTTFELKLAPEGTSFQRATWRQLRRIPYGTTISYGELAKHLGNPRAARAVGAANGRLTGYGGGIGNKKKLLELERGAVTRAPSS